METYTPEQLHIIKTGPWIRTYTNRIVNPLNLRPEDVAIEDIAHHLACSNRFVGALRVPVSIAQHSICVARLVRGWVGPNFALYGLLHDASEAYLGDVTTWLKKEPCMEAYQRAESRIQRVIEERFGIWVDQFEDSATIVETMDRADRLMVRAEAELGFDVTELNPINPRYGAVTDEEWTDIQRFIGPTMLAEMDWRNAKIYFNMEFHDLTRLR